MTAAVTEQLLLPAVQLRALLLPLNQQPQQLPNPLKHYLHFYGIDFQDRFPAISHSFGTLESGKFALAVHHYQLPDASCTLLLVHGYLDHCGLYAQLIEYGLQRGFNVVIFDLPGHGLSTGDTASIEDFGCYAKAVKDVLGACIEPDDAPLVMAQSTGCAALIECARQGYWPFAKTVMLAPLVRPAAWWHINLTYRLLHSWKTSVSRTFKANSGDAEFLRFVQQDPLQSERLPLAWVGALRNWLARLVPLPLPVGELLVIQGDRDKTVDWRFNLPYLDILFPNHQRHMLIGARHHLANETTVLRQQYLSQVDKFFGSIPIPGNYENT